MSITLGIALSFLAAFGWGTGYVLYKVGVRDIHPLFATFTRGLLAVPLLVIISITMYGIEAFRYFFIGIDLLWLIFAIITIAIGDVLSLFAFKRLDAAIAQPITAIYPVFTTLSLLIFSLEVITIIIIIGTLLNVLGVSVITFFKKKKNLPLSLLQETIEEVKEKDVTFTIQKTPIIDPVGIVFALIAALFWGITIVFTKLLLEPETNFVIPMMALRNGVMTIVAGIIAFIVTQNKHLNLKDSFFPSKKSTIFLVIGGAVTWIAGGVSFFTAVTLIGAGRSTPISSLSPLIVLLYSFFFLKEKIRKQQIVGIVLIVIGSILLSI